MLLLWKYITIFLNYLEFLLFVGVWRFIATMSFRLKISAFAFLKVIVLLQIRYRMPEEFSE